MIHLYLAIAAVALLGAVALQNYLVPALRQESISAGLTSPYRWLLYATYLALSVGLALAFKGTNLSALLAYAAAGCLIITGLTGSVHGPQWEVWHVRFTAATFAAAIALQFVSNHSAPLWTITLGGMLFPLATYFLVSNASVTEKVGVTQLCVWLVAWSL